MGVSGEIEGLRHTITNPIAKIHVQIIIAYDA